VGVPDGVWQHHLQEFLVNACRWLWIQRQGLIKVRFDCVRRVAPHGLIPQVLEISQHIVHHAVAEGPHGLPILGIEVFFVMLGIRDQSIPPKVAVRFGLSKWKCRDGECGRLPGVVYLGGLCGKYFQVYAFLVVVMGYPLLDILTQ
jgi:hypothetical protein